jgi:hypothetical protein
VINNFDTLKTVVEGLYTKGLIDNPSLASITDDFRAVFDGVKKLELKKDLGINSRYIQYILVLDQPQKKKLKEFVVAYAPSSGSLNLTPVFVLRYNGNGAGAWAYT